MTTKGNYRDAKQAGAVKYVSSPCPRCGAEVRYTSSKNCVMCTARLHAERKQRQREVQP